MCCFATLYTDCGNINQRLQKNVSLFTYYVNIIMTYVVRFSYPSILLIFVVIDCSVIGMLK